MIPHDSSYLRSNHHSHSSPYFIGESDVEFANPTRQHGYTLRPTLVLEPTHNRWSPYTLDTFEPDFPTIFEMFVGSPKGWYYRGTYRRIESGAMDLPNLTVGEYLDLAAMVGLCSATKICICLTLAYLQAKTRLLEQVLHLTTPSEVPTLSDPFASGEVYAQCIGLQCVGFNADLYHALVSLQSSIERQQLGLSAEFAAVPNEAGGSKWEISSPPPSAPGMLEGGGATALMKRLSKTLGHKRMRSTDAQAGRGHEGGGRDDDGITRRVKQVRTMGQNRI